MGALHLAAQWSGLAWDREVASSLVLLIRHHTASMRQRFLCSPIATAIPPTTLPSTITSLTQISIGGGTTTRGTHPASLIATALSNGATYSPTAQFSLLATPWQICRSSHCLRSCMPFLRRQAGFPMCCATTHGRTKMSAWRCAPAVGEGGSAGCEMIFAVIRHGAMNARLIPLVVFGRTCLLCRTPQTSTHLCSTLARMCNRSIEWSARPSCWHTG